MSTSRARGRRLSVWPGLALLGALVLAGCAGDDEIQRLVAEAKAACTAVSFNGQAETGDFTGWTKTANGGDGWAVCGAGRFCTSWGWDRKQQTIDLAAAGVPVSVLDAGAEVHVAESFALVFPQTMLYNLSVTLLDGTMAPLASWSTGDAAATATVTAAHVFSGYNVPGNPVRYLLWEDGGRDGLNWAGWYGPHLYGATLSVGNQCK